MIVNIAGGLHGETSGGFLLLCMIFCCAFVLGDKSVISKRLTGVSRCSPLKKTPQVTTFCLPLVPLQDSIAVFIKERHWHTAILRWRSQIQQSSKGSSVEAARNQTGFILNFEMTRPIPKWQVCWIWKSKTCHRGQSETWKISESSIRGDEKPGFSKLNVICDWNQNKTHVQTNVHVKVLLMEKSYIWKIISPPNSRDITFSDIIWNINPDDSNFGVKLDCDSDFWAANKQASAVFFIQLLISLCPFYVEMEISVIISCPLVSNTVKRFSQFSNFQFSCCDFNQG